MREIKLKEEVSFDAESWLQNEVLQHQDVLLLF